MTKQLLKQPKDHCYSYTLKLNNDDVRLDSSKTFTSAYFTSIKIQIKNPFDNIFEFLVDLVEI